MTAPPMTTGAQAHLAGVSNQLSHDGKRLSGTHHASSATSIVVPAAQQCNYCQRLDESIVATVRWGVNVAQAVS